MGRYSVAAQQDEAKRYAKIILDLVSQGVPVPEGIFHQVGTWLRPVPESRIAQTHRTWLDSFQNMCQKERRRA